MPTYQYQCESCEKTFLIQAKMQDPSPSHGPGCSLTTCKLRKHISRVFGQVAGRSVPPKPITVAENKPIEESPTHVCSKYCDLHKA